MLLDIIFRSIAYGYYFKVPKSICLLLQIDVIYCSRKFQLPIGNLDLKFNHLLTVFDLSNSIYIDYFEVPNFICYPIANRCNILKSQIPFAYRSF